MITRSRSELLSRATDALQHAGNAEAEVLVRDVASSLTRFANNTIHQNVSERGTRWRARLIDGRHVAAAETSGDSDDAPGRLMKAAHQALRVAPESDPSPLPHPDGAEDSPVAFAGSTAAATAEQRAAMVETVVRAAEARGLVAFGYVSTDAVATAIANSAGLQRQATTTRCSAVVVLRGEDGSGYAARHAADISGVDVGELSAEAVETCERNQNAVAQPPGDYEVVLSPYAVVELLTHLGWMGFSALAVQEHRSFMRLGERLMHERVVIRDDPRSEALFPFPFDAEGVTSRQVPLIDHGVCAGVVYDTPTAMHDGVASTGHSLPQPNTWGPFASHLEMQAGDTPRAELLAPIRRGLYVNRLWYVRNVHPLRTIITGMTREGTFLIEDGSLGRAVRDLRFTQSIVDALSDVRGVSSERLVELGEDESGVSAPWLHLGSFMFTS
ncbi:MAG: TldD/PmbA family protein [Candidatus Dormibacteraeota bacterium]|nr:TldD/PmbA family protein [Candidatus Dormibacteraeota bacterium]MBV8445110.1 TldD/PmbA family protein [Candidatus Dormibacteraeota bacterium]